MLVFSDQVCKEQFLVQNLKPNNMKNNDSLRYFIQPVKTLLFLLLFTANVFAQPNITLTPVITSGLNEPLQLVNAGDGSNRIFIVQKGGTILAFDGSYNLLSTFLTVTNISTLGERGLLSMAFHPSFSSNGFFYVYYTNSNGDLELARYKVSSNPNLADASSKATLITIPHPTHNNHNGGELHFGNDGYLYLSTGDGGGSGDAANNAQNTSVLLGKILRFNVNTSTTAPFYSIPSGNPFGNEIYDLGLRNPFRWSFDKLTGDMWIGDVGQNSWEEIDFRAAGTGPGLNYGWRCYEANSPFNLSGCGSASTYVFPAYTYPASSPAAITGGLVYRGAAYPALQGWYLSADFYSGVFYKIIPNGGGGWNTSTQTLPTTGIADFGETENGEAYAVSLIGNSVHRIGTTSTIGVSELNTPTTENVYSSVSDGFLHININSKSGYQLLEILNMNGAVVAKENINSEKTLMTPIHQLAKGVYLLRLSGPSANYVNKLIIQ
jgi:glucose/arabinose dehydrogenase